jgi:hypothetical protein
MIHNNRILLFFYLAGRLVCANGYLVTVFGEDVGMKRVVQEPPMTSWRCLHTSTLSRLSPNSSIFRI